MTKKIIFLLIILMFGISGTIVWFYTNKTTTHSFQKPIAIIPQRDIDRMITPPSQQFDFKITPSLQVVPSNTSSINLKQDIKTNKILEYISVGECPQNMLAPDYLSQKMGYGLTNKNNEKSNMMPSCGFIKTKIPF